MNTCIICGFGTNSQITGQNDWFFEFISKTDKDIILEHKECYIEPSELVIIRNKIGIKVEAFLGLLPKYEKGITYRFLGNTYLINLREDNNFSKAFLIELYNLINDSIYNSCGVYFFSNEIFKQYESMSVMSMMLLFPKGGTNEQVLQQINSARQESRTKFPPLSNETFLDAVVYLKELEILTVEGDFIQLTPKGKLLLYKP